SILAKIALWKILVSAGFQAGSAGIQIPAQLLRLSVVWLKEKVRTKHSTCCDRPNRSNNQFSIHYYYFLDGSIAVAGGMYIPVSMLSKHVFFFLSY
ncbi:hypothetical protein ACJX0J_024838, partial [Zea mays]